ncbi:hypothetical protein KK083_12810 [Fulvivirgaceae bacterium PWU4]|uniref:Uncharacterized protein n=1 Tax=Chryseosolibacter histidini TaxID=2782349 RepID=A0AAP2GPB5_9BACT|nr:hypothetical protein [Chryseosolibacter histidini]MBT1697765.1 hypothetical protein [Chryseosolibacter histidini]
MEAIRKIVTVKDNVLVKLPDSYNNKKVEVIIMPVDEFQAQTSAPYTVQEEKAGYHKNFYGSIKLGMTVEQIDKELKALRDEWERDIS